MKIAKRVEQPNKRKLRGERGLKGLNEIERGLREELKFTIGLRRGVK